MSSSPDSRGWPHRAIRGTSTSRLAGMELSYSPSDCKSHSPDNYKPLPLPPIWSPTPSISPATHLSRRSSSIYSQASALVQSDVKAQIPSLIDHPLPKINSMYYRDSVASTATMSEPQLLLPRTYSPALTEKSPDTSAATSLDRQATREQRPSALLPPIVPVPQFPVKKLHTVSLSKAQAAQTDPGIEHLLPEEHIARLHHKAQSSQDLANITVQKPSMPGSVFKIHCDNTIRLPSLAMIDATTWQHFDPAQRPALVDTSHWSGTTAQDSSREPSRTKTVSSSSIDFGPSEEPERGRTMQRGPRSTIRVQAPQTVKSMAAEYGDLVGAPWQNDDEPLTPQPLFSPKDETSPRRSLDNRTESSQFGTPPPPAFFAVDHENNESGVIPISPPPPADHFTTQTKQKKQYRESAYYPYVARRRRPKAHSAVKKTQHAAPADTEAPQRKTSDVPELLTRAARKAIKIADKVAAIARSSIDKEPYSPPSLKQSVTGVYLGWSEESKEDFDASKPMSPKLHYAASTYAPRPALKPIYQHIQTPARPLDERNVNLADERPSHARKNSIFGALLEMSREKGREKRREEIKKTIRMVPPVSSRPEPEPRSASEADVPVLPASQAPPPRLGPWGRRLSEFGML